MEYEGPGYLPLSFESKKGAKMFQFGGDLGRNSADQSNVIEAVTLLLRRFDFLFMLQKAEKSALWF